MNSHPPHPSILSVALLAALLLTGCATLPKPTELRAPTPLSDNSGKYLCPFTSDGTVSPWVAKGTSAKLGAAAGSFLGQKAGEKALERVPFVGGFLGRRAGEAAGRAAALNLVGGEAYMRETSDQSFDDVDDLIVFLYVRYSEHEEFAQVLDLTQSIYPEVASRWEGALRRARQS